MERSCVLDFDILLCNLTVIPGICVPLGLQCCSVSSVEPSELPATAAQLSLTSAAQVLAPFQLCKIAQACLGQAAMAAMARRTGHALMFLGALLTLLHELLGPTTMFTSSGVGAKSRAEAEALALKLGLGRPAPRLPASLRLPPCTRLYASEATLKEFLLDNSYVPPAVYSRGNIGVVKQELLQRGLRRVQADYKVASRGKYYVATAVVGGKAYQGAWMHGACLPYKLLRMMKRLGWQRWAFHALPLPQVQLLRPPWEPRVAQHTLCCGLCACLPETTKQGGCRVLHLPKTPRR